MNEDVGLLLEQFVDSDEVDFSRSKTCFLKASITVFSWFQKYFQEINIENFSWIQGLFRAQAPFDFTPVEGKTS